MSARVWFTGGVAAAVATSVLVLPGGAAAVGARSSASTIGAAGAGDPYFPFAGNGGYDVRHYDLDLRYTPPAPAPAPLTGRLEAVATIDLVATQDLTRFNLDLRGLDVHGVRVDGARATEVQPPAAGTTVKGAAYWQTQDDSRRMWELTIQPRSRLDKGDHARVVVTYGGTTTRPTDIEGVLYGWVTTRDGAMVVGEPEGSMTWYPVNDHPTDKASYSFEVTVPKGKVAVANGLPHRSARTAGQWTTWYWDAPDPQASYLTTVSVGDYRLDRSRTRSGVPIIDAVDDGLTADNLATTRASLALQDEMITFFERTLGEYPFNSAGAIVDDDTVDYALETQTRPIYSEVAHESTVAHEIAHQWLGNSVSPGRWQDIWLNEGWASYAEWLWTEHAGGDTAQKSFEAVMAIPASDPFWDVVIADPGPTGLFVGPVYARGAAALHALRLTVGDKAFFAGVRRWVERHEDGTATTEDFERVYEKVSGRDLDAFFEAWLRTPSRPAAP
jgi:aminopeptidase N